MSHLSYCSVCVIDIGKPGKNLGWALRGLFDADGNDLDHCIDAVVRAVRLGPVALGFEAPMFTPLRDDVQTLTKARNGEVSGGISRPFSASAGATVLVTALVVVPYVLGCLRKLLPHAKATLDWRQAAVQADSLLLFEAFVTNQRKAEQTRHVEDAILAIRQFRSGMTDPISFESSVHEPNCLNLLGASLLRTGWSDDPGILGQECLVVRPE